MKNIILVGIFLTVISCDTEKDAAKTEVKKDPITDSLDNNDDSYDLHYKIYVLEDCEYIVSGVGNTRWGSHKGNCKNPIHEQNRKGAEK